MAPGLLPYWQLMIGIMLAAGWILGVWHQLWRLYPENQVVGFSLWVLAATLLSFFLGAQFSLALPVAIAGCLLAINWYCYRRRWLFWELWEKLVYVLLALAILAGGLWLLAFFSYPFLGIWIWLLATAASNFYWRRYRSFLWYPSGKIGFIPSVNLFLLGLGGGAVAIWQGQQLLGILSLMVTFFVGLVIYLLSGRKVGKLGL